MTWPVPPSLAVYLKHPIDFFALCELDNMEKKPEGASDDEWAQFQDVVTRASKSIGQLVLKGRDRGVEALKATHERQSGDTTTPKTAERDWNACARVKRRNKGTTQSGFYLGSSLDHDDMGKTFLVAWVEAAGGGSAEDLLSIVKEAVPEAAIHAWFADATIALNCIAIDPSSDLDSLVEKCGETFERLVRVAKRLP